MTDKKNSEKGAQPEKVGYGNPPMSTRFKKGQSGNPGGRKKEEKMHKPVGRIIKHCLSAPVKGYVNGNATK
jgi:hypothetical protein